MAISARQHTPTSCIVLAALWPKLYRLTCGYCGGKEARGGEDIEGHYFHHKCERAATR